MAPQLIPYSTQTISAADIRAVNQVLKSRWLTTGPWVERFEHRVAKFVNVKYAAAVSSGTAALHLACLAAGISPGDEVITTPYSFAATANSILYCGATSVFVDIEEKSLTIDTRLIEPKITPKTKAIMAVDFGGLPADWFNLRQLAKKYGLKLVADSAHSFGATYRGKPIGTQADLTCFSFHPVKTITTGEGGVVVTNNKSFYHKILSLRNHGIYKPNLKLKVKSEKLNLPKPWYYEMRQLGYNYRLTDLQCALGLAQLRRVRIFLKKRRHVAERYQRLLFPLPYLTLPATFKNRLSAWHLYSLRIDFNRLKRTKKQLFEFMRQRGINLQVHYIPIHLHPYYRNRFGDKAGDFPISEKAYEQEVSLPLFPTLSRRTQDKVVRLLRQFLAK